MTPFLLLIMALPFSPADLSSLVVPEDEPWAACAPDADGDWIPALQGWMQTRSAGPRILGLEPCTAKTAALSGAELFFEVEPDRVRVWRAPGLWSVDPSIPILVRTIEAAPMSVGLGPPRRHTLLARPALAVGRCSDSSGRAHLLVVERDEVVRVEDDARVSLRPLSPGPRVRAGAAFVTCDPGGSAWVGHGDFARGGELELETMRWRDVASGMPVAHGPEGLLLGRLVPGTNQFRPDHLFSEDRRARRRAGRWLSARHGEATWWWVEAAGTITRGTSMGALTVGRGFEVWRGHVISSSPEPAGSAESPNDAIQCWDKNGRLVSRVELPGRIVGLSRDGATLLALTDTPPAVWEVALYGGGE